MKTAIKGGLMGTLLAMGVAQAQDDREMSPPDPTAQEQMPSESAHPQTASPPSSATTPSGGELRVAELKVKKVDRAKHKVTFDAQVSPEASFTKEGGAPIKIDQLREGDTVRAAFDPRTGEVMAVEVIQPAGKTTKTK